MSLPSSPICFSQPSISNSVVGQISGQLVKPKNSAVGWPRKAASVISAPFWSTSVNGAP